jgi:hypothetical protein
MVAKPFKQMRANVDIRTSETKSTLASHSVEDDSTLSQNYEKPECFFWGGYIFLAS